MSNQLLHRWPEHKSTSTSFLEYCRLRSLQPKTIDFYRWGLKHLARHCHELQTTVAS